MFAYSLVIFDLDGTLVDSAPNIAEALNGTLQELGLQHFS
ncbi:HAD hydrolase-like protein, partial [Xanthomonas vasicola]